MEKEFKKLITESKKSLAKIEKELEAKSENFTEEVTLFWSDLKKHISRIDEKLKNTYDLLEDKAELQGHLGIMEVHDRMEKLQETLYGFTSKVSNNVQEEVDTVVLRAHLAKMESEDYWEEKQKELLHQYGDAKEEAEKAADKAAKELNSVILKLTEMI